MSASSRRIVAASILLALASLGPAASPAAAQTATLQLSPSSGGPGTVISVVGSGFVPCLSFTVRWDSPRTGIAGNPASHTASLAVPDGAAGGSHAVTANCDPVASGGNGPLQIAVAYFDLIAPPPEPPPGQVQPLPAPVPVQVQPGTPAPSPNPVVTTPPVAAAPAAPTTLAPTATTPESDLTPAPARRPLRRVADPSNSDFPIALTAIGLGLLVLAVLALALVAIRFSRRRAGDEAPVLPPPSELASPSMPGYDLSQLADQLLSSIEVAPLAEAGPASTRLARACPSDDVASPLIATLLWESFVTDARFVDALRDAGASDRALDEGRILVVRHARETRHDLMVLDPAFEGANPRSVPVDLDASAASALDRYDELSWDVLLDDDGTAPVGEATISDALREAADAVQFGLIVARQPEELLTYCPSPAWAVRARGERVALATVGTVVEGPDGSPAVTTSAHALAGRTSVSVAGAVGTVARMHQATDSCLISVADLPTNSHGRGRSGPLRGVCPARRDHFSFEGVVSGVTGAQVIAWEIGILARDQYLGSRVYTTPETVPGDSGAALVDSADHIVGFATCRSAFSDPLEYSAWVWADQVLGALDARPPAEMAAATSAVAADEPLALPAPLVEA